MKKLLLLVPLFFIFGCSQGGDSPTATTDKPAEATAKQGEKMQGISADQVGVTDAGANADKMVGTKAGGGK